MPIALVALALTLIGLPVALIGLALYLASLYLASILMAVLIGQSVVRGGDEGWASFALTLLVGLLIVVFVTHTPFIGPVARVLIILTGTGILAERARDAWTQMRSEPA